MEDFYDVVDFDAVTRRRKVYKSRANPFDLRDVDFKMKYRFTKQYVTEIVRILEPDLIRDVRGCSVSPELQVLIALRAWGRSEVIMHL